MGTKDCPASLVTVDNIRSIYINALDSVATQDAGFIREYHVNAIFDPILEGGIELCSSKPKILNILTHVVTHLCQC